jgi:hypothetical protein
VCCCGSRIRAAEAFRDSPDKSSAQLESRLADGLSVAYVELGNENYFPDQAFGNVDSPEKYISHTKEVTAALKSIKADIQIAVNTDHHNYLAGSWNDLLICCFNVFSEGIATLSGPLGPFAVNVF